MADNAAKILKIAKAEVGYHEGHNASGWNNHQKYSPDVPGLEWSQGQAWCAVFVSWCAMKAGLADYYPRTASTDAGVAWWKARGQWSEYPAIGAQGYLAHNGDEFHTFLVADYDDTYVYTIEGNTNDNGSSQGDGVYRLKRRRRDTVVEGYGYPAFPEGLKSADPSYRRPAVKAPAKKPAAKPKTDPSGRVYVPNVQDARDALNAERRKAKKAGQAGRQNRAKTVIKVLTKLFPGRKP